MNLQLYLNENKSNPQKLESPLLSLYNIKSLQEYNLEDVNITRKQVETAKLYGIKGFGIYYYWFSENTITNKNTIMEDGYKNFFEENYADFKVFFIWANEDWSNNPAFNTNDNILNNYDDLSFIKNANNLVNYFKHENYYKINNKPVFFIHHPWFIEENQINNFYNILNNLCIENNFDGIELVVNSMIKNYENYTNYDLHPNYKRPPLNSKLIFQNKPCINYNIYVNSITLKLNNINTLFFDFNNTVRLYKPNKLDRVTTVIENSEIYIDKFIKKVIDQQKINDNREINNILLINAWNEWGEKMHIEPSIEKKYYYLNKIKNIVNLYN